MAKHLGGVLLASLISGMAFAKLSEIEAGWRILKNKLRPPGGLLWSEVTATLHEGEFRLQSGENIFFRLSHVSPLLQKSVADERTKRCDAGHRRM